MFDSFGYTHKKQYIIGQKLNTLGQRINDYFVSSIQVLDVFTKEEIWANTKDLANHKGGDIHGCNDVCERITKLFDLVVKKGFSASWTINFIWMIIKSGKDTPLETIGP